MKNNILNKVLSLEFSMIGDSLTQGSGGTAIPTLLSRMIPGRIFKNFGIGGQNFQQISARHGTRPIYISLSGVAFNGTAAVALTNVSTQFLSTAADNNTRVEGGSVNGIRCFITRTNSGSEAYTITPVKTSNTVIADNSIFYPDTAFNIQSDIQILWWGRNNVPSTVGQVVPEIAKAVTRMKGPKRFLIIGVLNATNEKINSANYNAIKEANDQLRTVYGEQYVESKAPTTDEMAEMIYTPDATDLSDIAGDTIPTGMRNDAVHLNTIGYQLMANRIYKKIISLNY